MRDRGIRVRDGVIVCEMGISCARWGNRVRDGHGDKLEVVTLSCLNLLKQEFVGLCASDHNSFTMYVPPSSRL